MSLTNPTELTLLKRSIELTHAEIITLPTTPVVVVPATETLNYEGIPTRLQLPLYSIVRVVTLTAPYSNIDAGCQILINLGSDNSFTHSPAMVGPDLLTEAGFTVFYPLRAGTGASSGLPILPAWNNLTDSLLDNAIVIACLNGVSGNFTEGHEDNVIRVTTFYVEADDF
jgi:hypothetical protein